MHFIASWDILAEGEEYKDLNHQMVDTLLNFHWVKPLSGNFYIIKVGSPRDRDHILENMRKISRESNKKIAFLASPFIIDSGYFGDISKTLKDNLKKIIR